MSLERSIDQKRGELHPVDMLDPVRGDGALQAVTEIFENKIGNVYALPPEMIKTAKSRFDAKVAPRYEDAKKKPEPDRYGDYFLWQGILSGRFARSAWITRPAVARAAPIAEGGPPRGRTTEESA